MTRQEFDSGPAAQQRYWARSHLGWAQLVGAAPNAGHQALARLDPELLITQNVDGLHERAGSRAVVALHGRIAEVICLACRRVTPRAALQQRLTALNPHHLARLDQVAALPDGDVDLDDTTDFVVPRCTECGGILKPHVVLFGENVPDHRVQRCYAAVESLAETDGALLVAGSSLTVMSGLRFVRRAAERCRAGGHREPGGHPRRRPGDVHPPHGLLGVPHRSRRLTGTVTSGPPRAVGPADFEGLSGTSWGL